MASSDNGVSLVTGLVLGGVIGTIVGILLAPKRGSETRAGLIEQSETLRARAEELAAQMRERVGPTVESVRQRIRPGEEHEAARPGSGSPKSNNDSAADTATTGKAKGSSAQA